MRASVGRADSLEANRQPESGTRGRPWPGSQPDRARLDCRTGAGCSWPWSRMASCVLTYGWIVPKLPSPVPTRGNSRMSGRLSVQMQPGEFARERSRTGGCPPTTFGQATASVAPRPRDARSRLKRPIDSQREPAGRGRPTAASPTANGKQNHGPAIKPTRNVLTNEHDHEQDGQPALPRVLEPIRKAFAAAARREHVQNDRQGQGQGQRGQARGMRLCRPSWSRTRTTCSGRAQIRSKPGGRPPCGRRPQPAQDWPSPGASSRSSVEGAQIGALPGWR